MGKIGTGGKIIFRMILLSLKKKFAFPDKLADVSRSSKNFVYASPNFAFTHKSWHSLKKLCFYSQNFCFPELCICSQVLCSHQETAFACKIWHPSKKLCVCLCIFPEKIFDYSQKAYITPSAGLGDLDLDLDLFLLQL